jgi:hypothetical protein
LVSILTALDELGYVPVPSKTEHIVSESIKKSFVNLFGQAAATTVLNNLSSLYGLSEKELTTNYDIFEKSLYRLSSYGANMISGYIKKEILIKAVASSLDSEITEEDITNSFVGIRDIMKKISYSEVTKFIDKILSGMHVVFVHQNEDAKNKVLSAFFNGSYRQNNTNIVNSTVTSTIKALISNKQTRCSHISNILHYEDLVCVKESELTRKIWDWITSFKDKSNSELPKKCNNNNEIIIQDSVAVPSFPPTIRIAIDDASWFLANNFRHELGLIEEMVKKYTKSSSSTSVLCFYKVSNISGYNDIDEETIMRIINSHSYVILEDPLLIYSAIRS